MSFSDHKLGRTALSVSEKKSFKCPFLLNVTQMFSNNFNGFINQVLWFVDYEVVGGGVFELRAAEATFEFGDAVKAVLSFVCADNTPKVVAFDAAFSGFTHGFHMKKWSGGIFGAKICRRAVVIGGFVAIEDHEVLRQDIFP